MPATAQIPRPAPPEPTESRNVRVTRSLWEEASELAAAEGLDISKVVRHYLQHYVDTAPGKGQSGRSRART